MTSRVLRYLGQAAAFGVFFVLVGYLSVRPAYEHRDPDLAQIIMSFSHTGPRVQDCRIRSPDEVADLAANMRQAMDCPRGRLPLLVALDLDGTTLYRAELPPAGIADDGASFVYARFSVPAGSHTMAVRLRDTRREDGFDHERTEQVELSPRQNFTIDFRPESGGFVFR